MRRNFMDGVWGLAWLTLFERAVLALGSKMFQKDNPEAYSLAHHVIQSSPSVGVCVTSTVHNDMMCTCICIQIFIYARVYTRFREYWQA